MGANASVDDASSGERDACARMRRRDELARRSRRGDGEMTARAGDGGGADPRDDEASVPSAVGALLLLDASSVGARERARREGSNARSASSDGEEGEDGRGTREGRGRAATTSRAGDAAGRVVEGASGTPSEIGGVKALKYADHRRLIYRWTNALIRAVGLKVPTGAGVVFAPASKNKREKFDRFLVHYYGTQSFEPGAYWYSHANAPAFFSEVFRVATNGRVTCDARDIFEIFSKSDPNRQASTWVTSTAALERAGISRTEVISTYFGESRVEDGWPKGRPLLVPPPESRGASGKRRRGDAESRSSPTRVSGVVSDDQTPSMPPKRSSSSSRSSLHRIAPNAIRQKSFGHPVVAPSQRGLTLTQQRALGLCARVEPGEGSCPVTIMPLIFDDILRCGGGLRSRPCEKDRLNKHCFNVTSAHVFLPEDVADALRIKDDAVTIMDDFKSFTASYFALKRASEASNALHAERDAIDAKLKGMMEILKTSPTAESKNRLEAPVVELQSRARDLEERLRDALQVTSRARKAFDDAESVVQTPYVTILRRCYELGVTVQSRFQKAIDDSFRDVTTRLAKCQIEREFVTERNETLTLATIDREIASLVDKQHAIERLHSQLGESREYFDFALKTLDQRWRQFSPPRARATV